MNAPAGAEVIVDRVSKSFGRISALREVSLRVAPREAVVITGRSGSGKSTLLAMIGGLEQPDAGEVLIDGRTDLEVRTTRPAHVARSSASSSNAICCWGRCRPAPTWKCR